MHHDEILRSHAVIGQPAAPEPTWCPDRETRLVGGKRRHEFRDLEDTRRLDKLV
jgi:hypothetical protein